MTAPVAGCFKILKLLGVYIYGCSAALWIERILIIFIGTVERKF